MYLSEDEKDITMERYEPWNMDLERYMEENAPAREVVMTVFKADDVMYMVPKKVTPTIGTFSTLLVGSVNHMLDLRENGNTLYEAEEHYEGQDTTCFRLKIMIPYGFYRLKPGMFTADDAIFAFYRKGIARPLSCRYAETSGTIESYTLNEPHEYGEYFVLVTGMDPAPELRKSFKKMGSCWRFDFEFVPNGIGMPAPYVTAHESDSDRLCLNIDGFFRHEFGRYTVQCYDEDYRLFDMSEDIHLSEDKQQVYVRLQDVNTKKESTYHVLLLQNLVPCIHVTIRMKQGKLATIAQEPIPESSPFYRLATDVGCNHDVLKAWNSIAGERAAKDEILSYAAKHDADEYGAIAVPLTRPDMDALVCFARLLYPYDLYECYNVEERIATSNVAVHGCCCTAEGMMPPVRVLCVTNVHLLDTPEGKACKTAVKEFKERKGCTVLYQALSI